MQLRSNQTDAGWSQGLGSSSIIPALSFRQLFRCSSCFLMFKWGQQHRLPCGYCEEVPYQECKGLALSWHVASAQEMSAPTPAPHLHVEILDAWLSSWKWDTRLLSGERGTGWGERWESGRRDHATALQGTRGGDQPSHQCCGFGSGAASSRLWPSFAVGNARA